MSIFIHFCLASGLALICLTSHTWQYLAKYEVNESNNLPAFIQETESKAHRPSRSTTHSRLKEASSAWQVRTAFRMTGQRRLQQCQLSPSESQQHQPVDALARQPLTTGSDQPLPTHPIQPFNAQLKNNPLMTRDYLTRALVDILTPAMNRCLTCGRFARFCMSDSGALYNIERNQIESFTRLLWGLGPLFANKTNIERYPTWWNYVTTSLLHDVDPTDPDYFGSALTDYDQLFVEMGAIVAFLYETWDSFWCTLTPTQQHNMFTWLEQVNHYTLPHTNWLLFSILVNS